MTDVVGVLDGRPEPGEVDAYYHRYLDRVPPASLLTTLSEQLDETFRVVDALGVDADYRYADGKWSVKEVLVHISDTERVLVYRALRIARGDRTPMPGFEQDDWVIPEDLVYRTLDGVKAELAAVRAATVAFFRGLTDEALLRTGTASGVPFTPRGLAWIVTGHELHHRRILQERYG